MEENKVCAKLQYKCGICGEIYDSIAERTKCEASCLKKQEEEERKAAEAKKLEEKGVRYMRIIEMYKAMTKEIESYLKDYGSIHIDDHIFCDNESAECPTLRDLLGWWWF